MAAYSRKKIKVSLFVPCLVFILFFSIMIWQKYRVSHDVTATPPLQSAEGSRPAILFFAKDGTRLAREARDIDSCEDDNACLKNIMDELLNGPVGELEEVIPEGTTIDAVRLEGELATVEFGPAFSQAMLSGSSAEMLAVFSVVNTVAVNFPQVKKVKINVAGNRAVILQHLDISEPLVPDFALEHSLRPEPDKIGGGSHNRHNGDSQ